MKKVYEAPVVHLEQFVANEYIAACGEENKVYKFVCDATTKWGPGLSGYSVYLNGPDGQAETSDDEHLGSYTPCTKTHDAPTSDEFEAGYMRKNVMGVPVGQAYPVIVWTDGGTNIHCTTKLNMESWETSKS